MKKIFSASFFVFLASLISFDAYSADVTGASITKIQGEAAILREGQTLRATEGQFLKANDVIKTEAGGTVDFSMNAIVGTRVLPSTEVTVADTETKAMSIKLKSGNLIMNLDNLPKESTFKVETPTAVASVRGTQFWGRVDLLNPENPNSTFAVRDGSVDVLTLGTNETITLHEGQALDIPKDLTRNLTVRNAFGGELAALDQASSVRTCS